MCASQISAMCNYTALFNLLDMPAGVLPVTTVTEADEEALQNNFKVADDWDKVVKHTTVGAIGMPVGAQVVGLPWQDELCLRAMKEVELGLPTTLKQKLAESVQRTIASTKA
eukprot:SAG31_NODE_963_length_10710_cov_332.216285_5_plen_112_part_00